MSATKEIAIQNLAKTPEKPAIKHGAYTILKEGCACDLRDETVAILKEFRHLQNPASDILIHEAAQIRCILSAIDSYLAEVGVLQEKTYEGKQAKQRGVTKEMDIQPVLKVRQTFAESLRRNLEALAVTPTQIANLGLTSLQFEDYASRASRMRKENNADNT